MNIWVSVPAFLFLKKKRENERLFFYAHEVSTARVVVEGHQGHDISFYNILKSDLQEHISLEERFGSKKHNSRNELIKYAKHFDKIFAVGDWVKKEFQYLVPDVDSSIIDITYNGIPVNRVEFNDKLKSRQKIQTYCENLFNFIPDVIMTHVSRLVISKGLWRDISMLEYLDNYFHENHIKGFFIILSSLIGPGRPDSDFLKWKRNMDGLFGIKKTGRIWLVMKMISSGLCIILMPNRETLKLYF